MLVLGIDPGTANTGYGVVRGDKAGLVSLVECGVIRTRPRDPLPTRLGEIYDGVTQLIARHRPDALSVEDVFYSRNVRTTVVLGHARGIILLAGHQAKLDIHEFPPAEIKKAVVGPGAGEAVRLHTYHVVREDGWQLFGFSSAFERQVFQRVLDAKGVGPALALGMLSTLSAERLVRAIREKDIVTLQSVPRVGRKKAEQLVLDLADKLDDVQTVMPGGVRRAEGAAAEDAIRALVSLGYSTADAEGAVKGALDDGGRGMSAPELIPRPLASDRSGRA